MDSSATVANLASTAPKGLRLRPWRAVASVIVLLVAIPFSFWQAPFPRPAQAFWSRSPIKILEYPIEVNGAMRLPAAPGRLHDVAILRDRIWAVGAGGTILVSNDGGRNWAAKASGTRADLWSVQFQPDGQRGWAVGDAGTILATADGGESWAAQTSGTQAYLFSVRCQADGRRGWAVGSGGSILVTNDGGRSWTTKTSGTQDTLRSAYFLPDGQRGWVVGNDGTILTTVDSGASWAKQVSGTQANLRSLQFLADGLRGWAVGEGIILATNDGGETWVHQTTGIQNMLNSVQFMANGQGGWAVGTNGKMLVTDNGGRSWADVKIGTEADLYSVKFDVDGQQGFAVGSGGTIIATRSGGRSWIAEVSGDQAVLASIKFSADGQHGWAVGYGGTILASADGGGTWVAQASGTREELVSLYFLADSQHGWAVGNHGTILATTDGGRNWASQSSGVTGLLNYVQFSADGQRGWVLSDVGGLLTTADGGLIWAAHAIPTANDLIAMQFLPDGVHGWCVGTDGTIVATTDGGRSWAPQPGGTQADLEAVQFLPDGRHGWIVGEGGTVLVTDNGGVTWVAQASGTQASLFAVSFAMDGLRGWAVGGAGIVLTTQDGGRTWRERESKVGTSRLGVWADKSGSNIWAAGYPPALLHSNDGGKTWKPETWPLRYARYPAPWFWLTLFFAGWLWTGSVELGRQQVEDGAETMGLTDSPTADFTQDRLRFGPLARGISRFLRNPATVPPLALAISGDWGSGKSSLMSLVCADLRRYGGRPVWFNAWHHQNGDQLLAGLLSAVRDQGLPSNLTLDGLAFRLRLLSLRSKKHLLVTLTMILLTSATVAFLMSHDATVWYRFLQIIQRQIPWIEAASTGDMATVSKADLAKLIGQLASGIATVMALKKALTAFGADPAVLLSAATEKFRLKDASELTNFRGRFSEQFNEVTEALPQRMAIVIDDLDRCRPEAILEVMEAVNFLVSSGSCFIIFGMATERVQAALALSFDKIASETAQVQDTDVEKVDESKKDEIERARRRAYARDYLEKLINLEIIVPLFSEADASRLFDREELDGSRAWADSWKPVLRFWPVILVAMAVLLGANFGWRFSVPDAPPAVVIQPAAVPTVHGAAPTVAPTQALPALPREVQRYIPSVQHGDPHDIDWMVFALPVALLAICLAGLTLYRLRAYVRRVQDTRGFRGALRAWTPLVRSHRATPRAVKRFGNRIRYLAMLHQAERLDESGFDMLRRAFGTVSDWFGRWLPGSRSAVVPRGLTPDYEGPILDLAEEYIVALGALNECYGQAWRDCASGSYSNDAQRKRIEMVLKKLKSEGQLKRWPPNSLELDRFESSLGGVRTPST